MVYTSRREDNDIEMVRTKLRRNLIYHKDYQEFYNSKEGAKYFRGVLDSETMFDPKNLEAE